MADNTRLGIDYIIVHNPNYAENENYTSAKNNRIDWNSRSKVTESVYGHDHLQSLSTVSIVWTGDTCLSRKWQLITTPGKWRMP